MSYTIYLQRFRDGEPEDLDAERFWTVITPHLGHREPEFHYVRIVAADGGDAGLFIGEESSGRLEAIAVERFSGGEILEIVARLARELDAVILLPEGEALLTDPAQRGHLPADVIAEFGIRVIRDGADITRSWD